MLDGRKAQSKLTFSFDKAVKSVRLAQLGLESDIIT